MQKLHIFCDFFAFLQYYAMYYAIIYFIFTEIFDIFIC